MTFVLLILLAAIVVAAAARAVVRSCGSAAARLTRRALCVLAVVACVCTVLARKGRITYPAVDADQVYLADSGSYVTNDFVHVNFTRIIVPASASLYIDRRRVADEGDDAAWINHVETTFGQFAVPQDIHFVSATNWDWMVYTTWTPGPSVLTNGVWHAMWGRDQKLHRHFIPLRTCVRVDGQVIATPKSKEDHK